MIKRQLGRSPSRMPGSIRSIVSRVCLNALIDNRPEYYANRVTARIAARVTEGADLIEMNQA
jgi:hypothetical protein